MGDQRGLSSGSNWPGGMQHLPPPREPSWGPYPPGLFLTQGLGSTGFLQRPPNGGCFFHGGPFNGGLAEAGWALPEMDVSGWSSRNPSSRATLPKTVSLGKEMYGSITPLNSRTLPAKRHGWPGVGGLDFSTQDWRACAYASVFFNCSSLQGNSGSGSGRKSFWQRHLGARGAR